MSAEPDLSPEQIEQFGGALDREHTRPPDIWRGKPLWPFTKGSRLLFFQVCETRETPIFEVLAFVFIHVCRTAADPLQDRLAQNIELGERKFSLMELCWNPNLFRAAIMQFREQLADEEGDNLDAIENEAGRIMTECFERDNKTRVIAGDRAGHKPAKEPQKKMAPIPEASLGPSRSSRSTRAAPSKK